MTADTESGRRLRATLVVALACLAVRALYLWTPAGRMGTADEAVFGLMAQRIAAFQEFPLYAWGAHYAGAPVSYVAAAIFRVTGPSFVALRLAMLPVAVITAAVVFVVYRAAWDETTARMAAALFIFCPWVVLHHTMAAYGGYGEVFLAIGLFLFLAMRIEREPAAAPLPGLAFASGVVAGFFLYVTFLSLPAIVAFLLPPLWRSDRRWQRLASFVGGGVLGAVPMIVYNLRHPGATFLRAAGRSTALGPEALGADPVSIVGSILIGKVRHFGAWLAEAPRLLGDFVAPEFFGGAPRIFCGVLLALLLVSFVVMAIRDRDAGDSSSRMSRRVALFLVLLVLFQFVANLNRARHLLPLFLVLPVALCEVGSKLGGRRTLIAVGVIYCLVQVSGWSVSLARSEFDPEPVADVMEANGVETFYGSYWTTYPIVFVTQERLAGAPYLLPFGTPLSDRTPALTGRVRSGRPAFVFGDEEGALRREFVQFLERHDVAYRRETVDGVQIFHSLSPTVHAVVRSQWETGFRVR